MMVLAMALAVSVLLFMGPSLLRQYVERLPEAPSCPACRSTTRQSLSSVVGDWIPALSMTVVRECARCGWRGRMRWRWALRHVRTP
jgi:hypothetical protein